MQPVHKPSHFSRSGRVRYRWPSGGHPMRAFIVEITAKVVLRSDTDPDELPANIYSRVAEHIGNDDDILDLCIEAMPLPLDLGGQDPH